MSEERMELFLNSNRRETSGKSNRTGFQRDFDRIVFSSSFRRLQSKTQVHPLPEADFIHTRLTHSIEASCVGRSLAVVATGNTEFESSSESCASIVAAACLAHDIGNPPFGHSGEDAISEFFMHDGFVFLKEMTDREQSDLQSFEGNAMGFRLLTHTLPAQSELLGGLDLTFATLGAFTKYPRESGPIGSPTSCLKKYGFFQSEKKIFERVAEELGLKKKTIEGSDICAWQRHPLAFLVEAADDICYKIMDLEDGFKLGLLSYGEIEEFFKSVIGEGFSASKLNKIKDARERVGYLRAKAVNSLVAQTAEVFSGNIEEIISGEFEKSLLDGNKELKEIEDFSCKNIYSYRKAVEIETAGFEVIAGLLEAFLNAVTHDSKRDKKVKMLIPEQFLPGNVSANSYEATMRIVQFVSSMTDTYAIDAYRTLKGIKLPNY